MPTVSQLLEGTDVEATVCEWKKHMGHSPEEIKKFRECFDKCVKGIHVFYDRCLNERRDGFKQSVDVCGEHEQNFQAILDWVCGEVFNHKDPKNTSRLKKSFVVEHERHLLCIYRDAQKRRFTPNGIPVEAQLEVMDIKEETDPKRAKKAKKQIDLEMPEESESEEIEENEYEGDSSDTDTDSDEDLVE